MMELPQVQPKQILEFEIDIALRKRYFVERSFSHPAKLHLGLLRWIVERYTRPGQTILDPMGGIGSTMLAAVMERNVIVRDVEAEWLALAHDNAAHIIRQAGTWLPLGTIEVGQHDARLPWNVLADHIVFSPPYGCAFSPNPQARRMILDKKLRTLEKAKYSQRWLQLARQVSPGAEGSFVFCYGTSADQIGHWRGRRYWQAMREIYSNALVALRPGGYMVLVTKDHIDNGQHIPTADQTVALCQELGFMLYERHIRKLGQLSLWQRRRRENGQPVIEMEDVLVFTKAG